MKYGTFNVKMHISLLYSLLTHSPEVQSYIFQPACEDNLSDCWASCRFLLILLGKQVGKFPIKHLSSNGPLFPFQSSLRFHDTVYLAYWQCQFFSSAHKIHKNETKQPTIQLSPSPLRKKRVSFGSDRVALFINYSCLLPFPHYRVSYRVRQVFLKTLEG